MWWRLPSHSPRILRRRFAVTNPISRYPPASQSGGTANSPRPSGDVAGKSVGVVGGTAHEAFAKAFMAKATLKAFPDLAGGPDRAEGGEIDYLFADGLGPCPVDRGRGCGGMLRVFTGGPIWRAVFSAKASASSPARRMRTLRRALDFALQQLWKEGNTPSSICASFPSAPSEAFRSW